MRKSFFFLSFDKDDAEENDFVEQFVSHEPRKNRKYFCYTLAFVRFVSIFVTL